MLSCKGHPVVEQHYIRYLVSGQLDGQQLATNYVSKADLQGPLFLGYVVKCLLEITLLATSCCQQRYPSSYLWS
jgi:hypothetical protein